MAEAIYLLCAVTFFGLALNTMLMFVDFELLTATDIALARANRLFLFFGAAFWVLAISWALLALINPWDETR